MPKATQGLASPPTFGIIGTGQIVRMMRPVLLGSPLLRIAAVAGSSPQAAAECAREFGAARGCADYRELLALDLDAVFIATPPHLHREMILAALAAGKHVVCEKPLVMNLHELAEVENSLQRHPGLRFASCSSRFLCCPPVRAARRMIASGRLGRILTVRLNISSEYPQPAAGQPEWKRRPETSGGGLLMDWGPYDLDWLRFLLGHSFEPLSVSGSVNRWNGGDSGLETGYCALINCRDGLTISLERRPEHGPQFQRAEIRGTDGGLDLPFMPGGTPPQPKWYHRTGNDQLSTETLPEQMCGWDSILSYPVLDLAGALLENRREASPITAQRGIYETITALYQSAAHGGRAVSIPAGSPG